MDRGEQSEQRPAGFRFPHTYAILFSVVIIAAALSYVIPAGEFERVEVGDRTEVVPGSYTAVEQSPVSFFELFKAIPTGLIDGANIISLHIPGRRRLRDHQGYKGYQAAIQK